MTIDKTILIKNIYYMLSYAFQQLKQNNYEKIDGENFDEIYDLFAEILFRGISFQLKQGLHKEYIPNHDTLPTLKGKMDLRGTINNLMQKKQKIDCDFDDLSENNLFNQILKTTVSYLLSIPKVNSNRKSKLRKLMLFFGNVDIINISLVKWTTLRFDRNCQTYQMLLYICYFIMDNQTLTTESGRYKMKGFTDDHMCKLFEKFVLEYYKKHHPELHAQASQIAWNIDAEYSSTNALPIMQTDIMMHNEERALIIDTKYYSRTMQERFGKATLHSNNIYQIQSYVMNHDKSHSGNVDGMLLYAKTDEDIVPDGQIKLNDGNVISFKTLDLSKNFDSIKKQLDDFVAFYYKTPK
jgi:5-methylcytosine-specific restriction enzyme subunit McrC